MKQECIPVGCVLSTTVAARGGMYPSMHWSGGVCPGVCVPRRESAWVCVPKGMCAQGVSFRGVSGQHGCLPGGCLPHPLWTEWLPDRCKNITLAQTSSAGVNMDFWSQEPFYWPNTNTITKNTKWRPFKIILSDWHIVWVFKILTAKWHITMIPPPPSIRCVTP